MLLFGSLSLVCLCIYAFGYDSFYPASFPGIVTNKTCAFVICNGILAFVLGNSGLMKYTTGSSELPSRVFAMASSDRPVCENDEKAEVRKEAIVAAEQDDNDAEGEMGKLSLDELNRKCEEFIKKMKEGMAKDQCLVRRPGPA